jgi:pimeloyl-ACP methyl ester carboxylesterase
MGYWMVAGLLATCVLVTGCCPSTFLARKMTQAPNRAPEIVKPKARVALRWPRGVIERFEAGTNLVGSPETSLRWLLIEPADYGLEVSSETSRLRGKTHAEFTFKFRLPREGLPPPREPIGTAFLLHGYGVDLETMFPWGLYLAEAGWRSVLVDMRGHGQSGGRRVFFGTVETNDLRELRWQLERAGKLHRPYVAVGHSLGAAIALRWQTVDPTVAATVAFGAMAEFVPTVARLRAEYASWVPAGWVRRATLKLPRLMGVPPEALDTTAALRHHDVTALLIAAKSDVVTPPEDSRKLRALLSADSDLLVVGLATHETLPYFFDQHGSRVRAWLREVLALEDGPIEPLETEVVTRIELRSGESHSGP